MSTNERVGVVAKITSAPGKRPELIEALKNAFENVAGEPGTLHYILSADKDDDNLLWMWEMYTDQAAVDSHMGSQWFKEWGPQLAPFMGGRPELIFVKPIGGKGF